MKTTRKNESNPQEIRKDKIYADKKNVQHSHQPKHNSDNEENRENKKDRDTHTEKKHEKEKD